MSSGGRDWVLILKGLELIARSFIRENALHTRNAWRTSSLRAVPDGFGRCIQEACKSASDSKTSMKSFAKTSKEAQDKLETLLYGFKEYQAARAKQFSASSQPLKDQETQDSEQPRHTDRSSAEDLNHLRLTGDMKWDNESPSVTSNSDLLNLRNLAKGKAAISDTLIEDTSPDLIILKPTNEEAPKVKTVSMPKPAFINAEVDSDFRIETRKTQAPVLGTTQKLESNVKSEFSSKKVKPVLQEPKKRVDYEKKQSLSQTSKERKVPSSRIGRLMSYGSLGFGLGVGALAEVARRTIGVGGQASSGGVLNTNPFLTEANAARIVDTLCRVRGAALKLGQMISLQDNTMINSQLQSIFERVRQSADFMPAWQMQRVLSKELGVDWRQRFSSFEEHPFAAASIGQVHRATLLDGKEVAIKIQYPGVAKGIDSDIDNLLSLMKVWDILPKGLFVENLAVVARKEMKWEVDYIREAECTNKFKKLVEPYPEYFVPEIISELSTERVLTSQLIYGTSIDKMGDADQAVRNWICEQLLRLVLLEVFQFNYMQTDPNWSNFFYLQDTNKINLVDFGACREFSKHFVDHYLLVIKGAIAGDHATVLHHSKVLGFTTGYESKVMEDALVGAAMALGEPFRLDTPFDFDRQETTGRLHSLLPIMLRHRLTPPPEESYSLHRKLSGIFLLCAKLRANINCKVIFDTVLKDYRSETVTTPSPNSGQL